ncbi:MULTISPECIES: 2-succinyl-6-hydroxy-2,4-cyclohexadiene-1-carboxylate synthase [unclassified Vibrio]|uniref:2-succinyl-6-hydroxy-2, 4-cyclohexadiene-1-carboxylate synthase n=1 Tax=unclassified Vibrio TaxID=2614977 RepID=UPI001361C277|nr:MULTISPECIES: 2-succinyl-6-hydroxy-2,4-cyclohexadiene-1-carboxylate synthase [unclassified Vibrio]NAW57024.1 2-succinyl-6-hydroxy-2,4-cyclohexadiene-1-carboxylate synthase [Vibrio sp. V36_P2S2PM302]NAX26447.1 2-succinyl-6-hydroxy-2,4-cyclohexadiene-1-carboxylate synthase [Vibrio sp. V38_P2S17PM301]NAX32614.1 2-succinyl-6-hydroxy-2,4-cyclohexadiene-1-carboxylate synthase [Vibrio sp. V37_P2S8PM304]
MLYNQFHHRVGQSQVPVLVFLHGLLGSGEDWAACLPHLHYSCLTVDLPGHGQSRTRICEGFDDCCAQIVATLTATLPLGTPIVMVGYSLGGRVAMYGVASGAFHALNLKGLLIEGGNFGLLNDDERRARWDSDQRWARRFEQEPIAQVLADWYQQAVFSSLNYEQRQILITRRSANLGGAIAGMLRATSLARQPYLLDALRRLTLPIHYICGEKDEKFSALALNSQLSFCQIAGVGHNVHQEAPHAFAQAISAQLNSIVLT